MLIGYVGSLNSTSSTNNTNGSAPTNTPTPQTSNAQALQEKYGTLARFVSEYAAYQPAGSSTPSTTTPKSTFGSTNPSYDPNAPADPTSNNGRVAANGILKQEQFGLDPTYSPAGETQQVMQTIAKHQNDPAFLQSYFGALGVDRTASILRYMTSFGHIQNNGNLGGPSPNTVTPDQARQQWQQAANALSTLAKNGDFTQQDMNRLVGQFANDQPQQNFMFASPGGLLSKASPEVNQMFYNSAKGYALNHLNSSQGQTMAAYAMQALSQTSMPGMMQTLANVPPDQLSKLVGAAMEGEAAYGNPPSIDEFSKTGIFRPQDGKGEPLDGLSHLMFDAAFAGIGDQFSAAPLSQSQAQNLQKNLFQAVIGTLESQPNVKSFYTNGANGNGVNMKDALAVTFQNDYDTIVKSPQYSGKDGELLHTGLQAFREFFADAVFSPPPSSYALGAIQTIQSRYNNWVNSIPNDPNAQPTNAQYNYAESLGEQMQAMSAGLTDSLHSILNNSAQADAATKDLFNQIISLGGTVVGAASGSVTGPAGGVGIAIVQDALTHLVNSSGDPQAAVNQAISELKSHGLDLSAYQSYSGYDLSTNIVNHNYRTPFQDGLQNNSIFSS